MADFIITQALGKGSYGSVFKVKRKQDNPFYAVKEVNIKKLQPKEREDAVNEIRIMASIKHKNIVRYCDAFVERDNLYIAMEFAEHGDISRQIDKFKAANKYIKEDLIWSYLLQMCNGLALMHSRNVLHRDLKPKNVFLTGKNHIRLGDLGCAKLMKSGMARTQIGACGGGEGGARAGVWWWGGGRRTRRARSAPRAAVFFRTPLSHTPPPPHTPRPAPPRPAPPPQARPTTCPPRSG